MLSHGGGGAGGGGWRGGDLRDPPAPIFGKPRDPEMSQPHRGGGEEGGGLLDSHPVSHQSSTQDTSKSKRCWQWPPCSIDFCTDNNPTYPCIALCKGSMWQTGTRNAQDKTEDRGAHPPPHPP